MPDYPKRLIEVDLPIKRISAHSRREKSIRHGHISTLHIWWARRPLAACRAVICAALWLDPADSLTPVTYRQQVADIIFDFATKVNNNTNNLAKHCSTENWKKWQVLANSQLDIDKSEHLNILRYRLLDFIADFANWDNSTKKEYLETSRALTQAAHEANGGIPETKPLVVDPFAGGGSIPLEALRVGADAFASDLNPVAVLLNKVVLEYIPKYGQKLADEVRKWGEWVKEEAEKELGQFYPKDEDGSTPIAYLWARTIISEAPDDGTGIPVEVPLMSSLLLAKKKNRNRALRWARDEQGQVKTETVEVAYADGVTRKLRRPLLEIFEPKSVKEVEDGTVARGSATCPVSGFTTPVTSVRKQLKPRRGGADDARLFCVVTTHESEKGRFYRLPNERDLEAIALAKDELERRKVEHQGELSLVPDEPVPPNSRSFRLELYGIHKYGEIFTSRQALALTTLVRLVNQVGDKVDEFENKKLGSLVQCCLCFILDKLADKNSSLCRWKSSAEYMAGNTFSRQALPIVFDYCEANLFGGVTGDINSEVKWVEKLILHCVLTKNESNSQAEQLDATSHSLPDDFVQAFFSDPPYYDAIEYSDLSDFFYVWLKRSLPLSLKTSFKDELTPKDGECIVSPHRNQDKAYFETTMAKAMAEGCRILSPNGIGIIVFAHKSTSGWEALLQAMIDAGWTITASWAIDTEMGSRLLAMNSAALASSIHLVCRPRTKKQIGDWRDVLQELPLRIHEWMPRLASEGIVGADAIFACLGPALEIFSRYDSVEKASGNVVTLKDYLEHVWAAVSQEALRMIFKDADTSSLEEDARLTAMWLWTLSIEAYDNKETAVDEDDESTSKAANTGFSLEYDSVRKFAQGLGAELENLTTLVEIKGDKARLLPVSERTKILLAKNGSDTPKTTKKKKGKEMVQISLFPEEEQNTTQNSNDLAIENIGKTVLDRIHQSMLLFASGRSDALKTFLVDDGIGDDQRFWTLAQSLSALYPNGTNEKRWVDGVLAKKKGLGF
ncbi:MAG: DUF1156 domain-containing protein [Gomphosphaeria aponina SAG 52.96 = DSM 107014]|uniref:DUF1156 domain-containing protein n=1 Tax=Gomphosphaeria aponina SAG 52.96 = DSM 107014 TaxID=1521640 RepID=A0A941JTF2_9CHRO|nr:DUF1156 domain-containing protein [Gomphosphaeria aponina SAG 52.96 = DSM 107014]